MLKRMSRRVSSSIMLKMVLSLLVIILLFFSVFGYSMYAYSKNIWETEIESSLNLQSRSIAEQINSLLNEKATIVTQMATNQDFLELLSANVNRNTVGQNKNYASAMASVNAIAKTDADLGLVWVAHESGNFLFGNGNTLSKPEFNIASRPWHGPAVAGEGVVFTEPYVDMVTGKLVITATQKITNNGKVKGFVAIDISLDKLPGIMKSYKMGESGYTFLLSKAGTVLYHPKSELIMNAKITEIHPYLLEILNEMVNGHEGVKLTKGSGQGEYIAYAPVKNTQWSVAVTISQKEATTMLSNFNQILFIGLSIGAVLLSVMVYFVMRQILRRIFQISHILEELATGNLTPRLHVRHSDELGQAGDNLNKMIESFSSTIQETNEVVELLASSSTRLNVVSEETSQTSQGINIAMEHVVHGAENQYEGTRQILQAMEDMTAGVQLVASSTTSVADLTSNSLKDVKEGNRLLEEAISQMLLIRNSVGQASQDMDKLKQLSQQIDTIVGVISDISTQTKLLSLNASIEAARAGEHGRGFAVVATEVKKLADQTDRSVGTITEMIKEVQAMTTSTAMTMSLSVTDVEQGSLSIDKAGEMFQSTYESFREITDQTQEVSAASEQMSAGTEEVTASMDEINNVTHSTLNYSQEVLTSVSSQLQSIQEIAQSATELSKVSAQLRQKLSTFVTIPK